MKVRNILLLIILISVISLICSWLLFRPNTIVTTDAIKFKTEYEKLNNVLNDQTNIKYTNVTINNDNPIKYVNSEEASSLLEEDKAILFVGSATDSMCRLAVPIFLEVAQQYNIKTIYYLDLTNEKSIYEVSDNKLVQTKVGSDGYYKLLNNLDLYLAEYTLTVDDRQYFTGEKQINVPAIFIIKNQNIVDQHSKLVQSPETPATDSLSEDQIEELKKIYIRMIEKLAE